MSTKFVIRRRWIAAGVVVVCGCVGLILWMLRPQPMVPVAHPDAVSVPPSPAVGLQTPPVERGPRTEAHGVTAVIGGAAAVAERAADEGVRQEVQETGTLAGHVAMDGAPLAGVTVVLSTTNSMEVVSQQVSGERGAFQFEDVPSGIYDLQGEYLAGPRERPLRIHQAVVVEAGATTRATLLFPGAPSALEGYVTRHGDPVAEAKISGMMVDDATEDFFGASTNAAGFYRVANIMPGPVWLDVVVDSASGSSKQRFEVDVPAGSVVRQDAAFDGTATVYGVVDGIGAGEIGEVMLVPAVYDVNVEDPLSLHALRESAVAIASIDDDGAYRFDSTDAGDYTAVAIVYVQEPLPDAPFHERLTIAASGVRVVEGQEARVDLQLPVH